MKNKLINITKKITKYTYNRSKLELSIERNRFILFYEIAFFLLLGSIVMGVKPYKEMINPVTKLYTPIEEQNYFLKQEVNKLRNEIKKINDHEMGLRNGDYEAVKNEVKRVFRDNWKGMFATIQAENGPRNGKFNCKVVQDWLNKDGSIDYGLGQVNSVHLWMVNNQPERLLDCKTNIAILYRIWDRADGIEYNNKGNLTPWVAYNDNRADKFLAELK